MDRDVLQGTYDIFWCKACGESAGLHLCLGKF